MQLDGGLMEFLARPVMCIIGTANAENRPSIGRGLGVHLPEREGVLEVAISAWQWPDTVQNIRETGRLAVTFASPADYVSYQMKGAATLRPALPDDIERCERDIARVRAELLRLGVSERLTAPWLASRQAVIAIVDVAEIYVQTPGRKAGMAAGAGR